PTFVLYSPRDHPAPPSFPTRRSSDLHVDLIQFDGDRIFDIVRRVAPSLLFEVDLHWVQRGGMAPLDMLEAYTGACKLIHVKDFRDWKSTRLNSSHVSISYAVFCLKKK